MSSQSQTLSGTVTQILDLTEGVSKAGKEWQKRELVVQIEAGEYPKSVCFQSMNSDIIGEIGMLRAGDEVTIHYNLESKEWNGRFFTNAIIWRIESEGLRGPATAPAGRTRTPAPAEFAGSGNDSDLPF